MSSSKGTPNNVNFRKRMTDSLMDLLADRRHGKFGIAGEVFDGHVGYYEEVREPRFLPESGTDKRRVNHPMVLAKLDELCGVVMVHGWTGAFGLTWEEGSDIAVASISIRKKEKAMRANVSTV